MKIPEKNYAFILLTAKSIFKHVHLIKVEHTVKHTVQRFHEYLAIGFQLLKSKSYLYLQFYILIYVWKAL